MENKISELQTKIFDTIAKFIEDNGYPPTLRELCKLTNTTSTWTIRYHLNKLQAARYIKIQEGLSRGIILVHRQAGIPLVGHISAGLPIEAIENIEEYINIGDVFGHSFDIFALRITGNSMIGAGIHD
ncbi:LexA family protein, partial [bacterium]